MRTEIIAIGDELLAGYILNTNAQYIAKALLKEGVAVSQVLVIKDRHEDMVKALKEALERSDIIFVTGGLGPTVDDITREAACHVFNVKLVFRPEIEADLIKRYGVSSPSIENQATQPDGARILMNPVGSAPGLVFEREGKVAVFLPGPPPEMKALFDTRVLPLIRERISKKMHSAWLYLNGMSESDVDPYLHPILKQYSGIELGIYPAPGLLTVSVRGYLEDQVKDAHASLAALFKDKSLELIDSSLTATCKHYFIKQGLTLSAAESLSGGHLSALLTKLPGASDYFLGSIIAYANSVKTSLLSVPEALIQEKGAVSKEVAILMAKGVRDLTKSSIGVSLTGIAGPTGGSSTKPVGTYFAAITDGDKVHAWQGKVRGTREMIIEWVVNDLLFSLIHFVK